MLPQLNAALKGRYEIDHEIGAGGMATVYLARDLRHDRNVALKLLKPELGAVLGVERFLSEIKVTANLQHPNLLPLFDSGEVDGLLFYVMPFVEGESLRARLDREKQLPVDTALHMATSIANALDYAHRQHVIHRDLKPENILIHEGEPLVADFGIALAISNAGGNRVTQTGLSLGTPQYMSPEQATGDRAIDGRTDIYSLAAVLYEMLTGDPPHIGSTAQAVIARVLTERPRSVRASRPNVPEHVEAALERGLEKLPADRFATARDFASALNGSVTAGSTTSTPRAEVPRRRAMSRAAWAATAIFAGACVLSAWAWTYTRTAPPVQRSRFAIAFPDSLRDREELPGQNIAISPDGSQIVYLGGVNQGQLYIRPIDDLEARPIRGTERGHSPRFSPDGKWLAFVADGRLKKISPAGGPAIVIADSVERPSWGDNGDIIFSRSFGRVSGLWRVSAGGGPVVPLITVDTSRSQTAYAWPFVLPGGTSAVFTIERGSVRSSELAAVRFADGKVIPLGVQGTNPRYVSSGHLIFGKLDGTITAVPFDARRLRVLGPPVTVLDGLIVKGGGATEAAVSNDGTLVYSAGNALRQVVLVDFAGNVHALDLPRARYENPRFAPKGDRIAVEIAESAAPNTDVWVYNVLLHTMTRLTRDGKSSRPEWSADGKRIAWNFGDDTTNEVRWQAADGSGQSATMFAAKQNDWALTFSPAGRFVAASHAASAGQSELVVASVDSTTSQWPLFATRADNFTPRFSPDGKWVAYASSESGANEIYVTSAAGGGGRFQISTDGGTEPLWSPDGHTIYYRSSSRITAARVVAAPSFAVVRRDSLFMDTYVPGVYTHDYDVSPDGKSLLMLRSGDPEQRIVVVFGWLNELRDRMALAARK